MLRAPATSDDARPIRLMVGAQLQLGSKEMRLVLDDETASKPTCTPSRPDRNCGLDSPGGSATTTPTAHTPGSASGRPTRRTT